MRSLLTGNCIIVQIVKSDKNKKVILIRNLHVLNSIFEIKSWFGAFDNVFNANDCPKGDLILRSSRYFGNDYIKNILSLLIHSYALNMVYK